MRDLEVIDDEELKSFLWHLQPEGPVIEWIRKDLNKYNNSYIDILL